MAKSIYYYKAFEKQKKPKYAVVDVIFFFQNIVYAKMGKHWTNKRHSRSGKAVITYLPLRRIV